MANPHRGEVSFTVDGKSYTIRLGRNAMAEAEAVVGRPFPAIVQSLGSSPEVGVLRAVLWAGLHRHHPELDLLAVGDLMDEAGDEAVTAAIAEALRLAFPQPDDTARPQ